RTPGVWPESRNSMGPESLCYAFLLAITGLVLVRSRAEPWLKWFTVLSLSACAIILGMVWSTWAARKTESPESFLKTVPGQGRPDGYVSSDKCQCCHPGQYESWRRTYHRTMTQVASQGAVLGDFNNVRLTLDGSIFLLQQRGDQFWVEMNDPEWKPDS